MADAGSREDALTQSRPQFTPGYGVDRGVVEHMLPWEEVSRRMEASRSYWIVTTRADGRPHAAPVWGLWMENVFHFSTDPRSRKARNFLGNPNIVVHLESGDEVVILEGMVERIEPNVGFDFQKFADAYEAKYAFRPEPLPQYGFYRLQARKVFAWTEQDFPNTATRWRVEGN